MQPHPTRHDGWGASRENESVKRGLRILQLKRTTEQSKSALENESPNPTRRLKSKLWNKILSGLNPAWSSSRKRRRAFTEGSSKVAQLVLHNALDEPQWECWMVYLIKIKIVIHLILFLYIILMIWTQFKNWLTILQVSNVYFLMFICCRLFYYQRCFCVSNRCYFKTHV